MNDNVIREIEDLRLDIDTLRTMVDFALVRGVSGEDMVLRALANVLYDKRRRLSELEDLFPSGTERV